MTYIQPNANGQATSSNSAPVVIASDQSAVAVKHAAQSSGGATAYQLISAASTNATNVKASAGTLYGVQVFNTGSTIAFLKLYNKASSPSVGSDTPVKTIGIPAGGGSNVPVTAIGIAFTSGLSFAITGQPTVSDTTGVTAAQIIVNIDFA